MTLVRKPMAFLMPLILFVGCGEETSNTHIDTPPQGEAMGETPKESTLIKDAQGEIVLVLMHGLRSYDDPCRSVGETAATADYLDHTTRLIACPVGDDGIDDIANRLQGTLLSTLEGYQLISIPNPNTP